MSDVLPQDPVFVVGYPRSGTTLLQGLLLSQRGFRSLPETHYFSTVERRLLDSRGRIPEERLDEALARIVAKTALRLDAADVAVLRARAGGEGVESKDLFELVVSRLLRLSAPEASDHDAPFRWIEKTPVHASFLGRIRDCYPRLRAVHILRHPVPAILSRRRRFSFNRATPLAELALRWNELQENVRRFAEAHPEALHRLRYEDLIADTSAQMSAVARFLGFAYDTARASGWRESLRGVILPFETWKQEDLVRPWHNTNDAYRASVDRGQVEEIESVAGEIMRRCGYGPFFAA